MAQVADISPTAERSTLTYLKDRHSASGRGLTIAVAGNLKRVYLGNNSGVWRSDDGGVNWKHMTRPQPKQGTTSVPGALLPLNVYDLAVAANPDIVLASTGHDIRRPSKAGIYRSTDGGRNWNLEKQFDVVGQIITAPDDRTIFYVACGAALMKGINSGATWSALPVPLAGEKVWHVAAGPGPDATRRIYALGTNKRIWFSTDGGTNWSLDTGSPVSASGPVDAGGPSTRILAIHPSNPNVIYAIAVSGNIGTVNRGDYTGGSGTWTALPASTPPPGTTPSGTRYVRAHVTFEGQLYLFASDQSGAYVSIGEPAAAKDWIRIDGGDVHFDPHSIWVSIDFRLARDGSARGNIWQVNDGGVYWSIDGGVSWKPGHGLSTLSPINVAVSAQTRPPALSLHTGDNGGFFSSDDGKNWKSADYQQGDNDACFVDPRQPGLMYTFAPRGDRGGQVSTRDPNIWPNSNGQLILYTAPAGKPIDAGAGTDQRTVVPGPTFGNDRDWNCGSDSTEIGYRPLILTLPGETPIPGGDFIAIRYPGGAQLVRTQALATVTASANWFSAANAPGPGVRVFQEGPPLPNPDPRINIVQASGGHTAPVYYAGNTTGLWKWTQGMKAWGPVVPGGSGPSQAIRFYVDPYRPDRIYLIDGQHVWRSSNGGASWTVDNALQAALTEKGAANGAFPMDLKPTGNPPLTGRAPFEALLQDFVYDPDDKNRMIAAGPAGIFASKDGGTTWNTLALFSALHTRTMSTFLDTISDAPARTLYVATPFRGLLKTKLDVGGADVVSSLGFVAKALLFKVFREFPDPFVASPDPANPDTSTPQGKLQKALTDALAAKANETGHHHVLKVRNPGAADLADAFPIPFTIADVSGAQPFPVAHYNGDEVDFIASVAQLAIFFAAMELRLMVRRYVDHLQITTAAALLSALDALNPKISNAAPLIKDKKNVLGRDVQLNDDQILPHYLKVLDFDESDDKVRADFKGAIAAETDPKKKKEKYDFGSLLFDMVVNGNTEAAQQCVDRIGYGFINGALEAGGFFERPSPNDPKTFRGIWVGGNFDVPAIRGEMSVNDGPAQFGGTTRTLARLLALIRAKAFGDSADPNKDLMSTLLSQTQGGKIPPALQGFVGGKFSYELNKPGVAQLGFKDPRANRVRSEVAMIKTSKPDGNTRRYVVAWQNLEMKKQKDGSLAVDTKSGHLLYSQKDIVDIITSTLAAYE